MNQDSWDIRPEGTGCAFKIHVTPRSSKTGVAGLRQGALRLKVHAPPVEGAANEEVVEFFAESLQVSRSAVTVVRGQLGRAKTIRVLGLSVEQVRQHFDLRR